MSKTAVNQPVKQFVQEVFQRYDWDRSGTLSAQELTQFMTQYYESVGDPTKITPEVVQWYMNAIDSDGDGKVSKEDMIEAFRYLGPKEKQAVSERPFLSGIHTPSTPTSKLPVSPSHSNMRNVRYPGSNREGQQVVMMSTLKEGSFRQTQSMIVPSSPQQAFTSYSSAYYPRPH